jgi:hypothetical protein
MNGHFQFRPRLSHAQEFAEPGDDRRLRGLHGEKAEQADDQQNDDQKPEQDHAGAHQ